MDAHIQLAPRTIMSYPVHLFFLCKFSLFIWITLLELLTLINISFTFALLKSKIMKIFHFTFFVIRFFLQY